MTVIPLAVTQPCCCVDATHAQHGPAPISGSDLLFSLDQTAEVLRIGRTKMFEILASGELPTRYLGRRRVVLRADLEAYVAALPTTPPTTR
jgi:excisionase family DNA binding protein